MEAKHAAAVADLEAANRLNLLDSESLRAQIEQQKQEKAGRLMRYCLNRMADRKCVEAWERWVKVRDAMARAGLIMHRTLCRLEENALVCGWCKWHDVQEAQQHAGTVMNRCLARLEHIFDHVIGWMDEIQASGFVRLHGFHKRDSNPDPDSEAPSPARPLTARFALQTSSAAHAPAAYGIHHAGRSRPAVHPTTGLARSYTPKRTVFIGR